MLKFINIVQDIQIMIIFTYQLKTNIMIVEKHLEGVTVESIEKYKETCFQLYASSRGVKLGFDGFGMYIVKTKDSRYESSLATNAIEEYKKLVRQ